MVVADAPGADLRPFQQLLERAQLRVAADGGARYLIALGLDPDLVIGDLDSPSYRVRRSALRELEKLRAVARPILEEFYANADSAETHSAVRRILAIGENTPRFTDEDIRRMARLVESLRRVELPQADQILRLVTTDFPDESVKATAREILTTHGG